MSCRLLDTHSHLDQYPMPQLTRLVDRASRAGVGIVSVAVNLASARRTLVLSRLFDGVFAAIGLHPSFLTAVPDAETWRELGQLARDERVVAIGEIGLDDGPDTAPLPVQQTVCQRALALAVAASLPVSLHLPAHGGLDELAVELLRASGASATGTVSHYFTGPPARARFWLDHGAYLAFGKPVTRLAEADTRASAAVTPLDRLLLETDSYPLPGRTTEPVDLTTVAQAVADLRGVPVSAIADATNATAARLFSRPVLRRWLAEPR